MAKLKNKKNEQIEEKSQYEKEIEERGPNLSSYEDDPLLNMDPVFADDDLAQAASRMMQETHYEGTNPGVNPLSDIIRKHRENNPVQHQPKIAGPLGDIIGNAIKKSAEISADVAERDPVIAKLRKIDELLRTGGTDAELYTDVKKSQVGYYAQRAKDFIEQQVTKKPESDADRIARMARETRERGTNNYVSNHEDRTEEIKNIVTRTRNRERGDDIGENDVRKRAQSLIQESSQIMQKRRLTNFDNESKSVFSVDARERFNIEKRMEQQKERVDIGTIAKDYKEQKMTPEQIAELEAKIKKQIEKVQKHKAALAKKEEKMMKLIVETDAKSSSEKIARILEQRTMELEIESNLLIKRENELESTIADLKTYMKQNNSKLKTKNKGNKNTKEL